MVYQFTVLPLPRAQASFYPSLPLEIGILQGANQNRIHNQRWQQTLPQTQTKDLSYCKKDTKIGNQNVKKPLHT